MVERNGPPLGGGLCNKPSEPLCCISVNRIFDSVRDKDCLEDLRVFLSAAAQEAADRATAVRTLAVDVIDTAIHVEPVPFNKGYFQVTIRFYFCITLEFCLCGGRTQIVKGLAAFDKKAILFGSEKNVSVYTSDPQDDGFCRVPGELKCEPQSSLPGVVCEVAPPICLDTKIVERCCNRGCNCCLTADSIPENICGNFDGGFVDDAGVHQVLVTLGMFTVIRMERPVQLLIPACHYCIPEKESNPCETCDTCSIFGKMPFPLNEFFPFTDSARNEQRGDQRSGREQGQGR